MIVWRISHANNAHYVRAPSQLEALRKLMQRLPASRDWKASDVKVERWK